MRMALEKESKGSSGKYARKKLKQLSESLLTVGDLVGEMASLTAIISRAAFAPRRLSPPRVLPKAANTTSDTKIIFMFQKASSLTVDR